MINKDETVFVLVDVQGKLAKIIHESEELLENIITLIDGLRALDIPILWLEQYPRGLGPTTKEVANHLDGLEPISKMTFSACKNKEFMTALKASGKKQAVVAGIEAHVCVYQTSAELKELGYEVQVVADAVSSRTLANKEIGLEKMKEVGVLSTSVEMILFELMETAECEKFKEISKLIK
ncbi:hydrolase [Virgibacillus alimentarius]|uniref:hydrolase n=1 Tax=Virgibacillus alimentarius TaxID=698769 RepID=UPI000493AF1D|nr:hydrolase [Virgibacillus alimentarius]